MKKYFNLQTWLAGFFSAFFSFVSCSLVEKREKALQTLSKKPVQVEFKDLKTDAERGEYYYTNKNYKEAFKWYKKAAEQGHAEAQFNLGKMYHNGLGVAQNHKEAFKWVKKAAEQGHAKAQFVLGVMYDKGQGVAQNHKEAFRWYKKAAEQGFDLAQFDLAGMYYEGRGVAQNHKEAFRWYKKAAEQGLDLAQFDLARMYYEGKGISKNIIQAYVWLYVADFNGYKPAEDALKELSKAMSSDQIDRAKQIASRVVKKN